MIIVIANQKGGVSKSTIATNTAAILAAKKRVLLIDHDTSHVSKNFHNRREYLAEDVSGFNISVPKDLEDITMLLELENYDAIVVDLGGFTDDLAKAALIYADLIVIPTSTSTQDMDGNIHFIETLDKLKAVGVNTKAVYAANNTDPRMKQKRIDIELDYITDKGYSIAGVVPHYADFSKSHGKGMSIVEYAPNTKAAVAMQNLVQVIVLEAKNG